MEGDQRRTRSRKKIETATRQSAALAKMMAEQPFDPQDPLQQFYRQDQSMGPEGDLLRRFGWRVADIAAHQQEPTLQCMAMLTSEFDFPISTGTHLLEQTAQARKEAVRSLWIELTIITSSKTQDILVLGKPTPQSRLFSFCYQQLLPLLKDFIKKYLSWQSMVSGPHDNAGLLEAFRKEVVETANSNFEKGSTLQKEKE